MKNYHHKTNACQNCCKTGEAMAEYIKYLKQTVNDFHIRLQTVRKEIANEVIDIICSQGQPLGEVERYCFQSIINKIKQKYGIENE